MLVVLLATLPLVFFAAGFALPAGAFATFFLLALFAARFGARFFLAGVSVTGGTIMGSETRPSAASGT